MKVIIVDVGLSFTATHNIRLQRSIKHPVSGLTSNVVKFLELPKHVFIPFKKL